MSDLLAQIRTLASINQRVNLNAVASLTWIVYDILTCMDQEVELIWKTRWTLPKVLYVSLRYFAPLWLMYQTIIHLTPGTKLSVFTCKTFPPLQAIGPLVLWILVDAVMILRIRALYRGKKSVFVVVVLTWLAAAGVVIPVTIFCFRQSRPVPAPALLSSIAGCLVMSVDWNKIQNAKAAVIAFLILNIFYMGLALYKFAESVKSLKKIKLSSIYTIFIAEGVSYFLGVCVVIIADLVFSSGSPSLFPFVDLAQFWMAAFYSYAGCHLILHLRASSKNLKALQSFGDCADLNFRSMPSFKGSDTVVGRSFDSEEREVPRVSIPWARSPSGKREEDASDVELPMYIRPVHLQPR